MKIDWASFASDIQRQARSRGSTIRGVGKNLSVRSATMHRAATGKPVEAATFLGICQWLGYSPWIYWTDE